MYSHFTLKKLIYITIVIGIVYLCIDTLVIIRQQQVRHVVSSAQEVRRALPLRMKIPKINLDAIVESVGRTSEGVMDTPKYHTHVGWLNDSVRPGEQGMSLIDGHFGLLYGMPAAFDLLHKVAEGDKVYVYDEQGRSVVFVVYKVASYDQYADTTLVMTVSSTGAYLNLITCGGVWSKNTKTYSQRLVVFTKKEG